MLFFFYKDANPSFDGSGASTDGGEAREVFDEKSLNPNLQDFKEESDEMLTAGACFHYVLV